MTTWNKKIAATTCTLLALLIAFMTFCPLFALAERATACSDVLDDLEKDETFDLSEYPSEALCPDVELIQIAETTDNELLLYTYQKGGIKANLNLATVRFYQTVENVEIANAKDYAIKLVSQQGTLNKYLVLNFTVAKDDVRYYNFVQFSRPFNSTFDKRPSGSNNVSQVAVPIAELWSATTVEGDVEYLHSKSDVVHIANKYCGTLWFKGGRQLKDDKWVKECTMANFVAFSTDKAIDSILRVDITYTPYVAVFGVCNNYSHAHHKATDNDFSDAIANSGWGRFAYNYDVLDEAAPVETTVTPQTIRASQYNKFHKKIRTTTWDTIMPTAEFVAAHETSDYGLSNNSKSALSDTQWVLTFAETDLVLRETGSASWRIVGNVLSLGISLFGEFCYKDSFANFVGDVSVMDITYEYAGKVYSLGLIDNKQSPSEGGDTVFPDVDKLPDWAKWALIGLAIVAVILLCSLIKPLTEAVICIFKALWWIISAPIKAIIAAIRNSRNKK